MKPELKVWLEFEKVEKFLNDLEEADKYFIFADLERQYQERLLLQELNQDDEITTRQSSGRDAQARCANYGDGS